LSEFYIKSLYVYFHKKYFYENLNAARKIFK
jgi:hypothetical protein